MTLRVEFRSRARAELDESAAWYDLQQPGLGADFIGEVQIVLDKILEQPDRYSIVMDDVREAPVRRFPFCVYYRMRSNRIIVISVFHHARDPAIWQSRS